MAVFHLQQGIEKTGKAVLYLEDIVVARRHNLIEVSEHWYNDIWQDTQRRARRGRRTYRTYNVRLTISASTRTNTILIQALDRRYMDVQQLNALYSGEQFRWKYQRRIREVRWKEKNLHLTRFIEGHSRRICSFTSQEKDELVRNIRMILNADLGIELVTKYKELLESLEMLFVLALLTAPHEQTTRYSDSGNYTENARIIEKLPDLLNEIKRINRLWKNLLR